MSPKTAKPDAAAEIARDMRKLGYDCPASLVRKVAAHDPEQAVGPIPENAALAANIRSALASRKD